ncbi:MAG: hypothetical protein H0W18_05665, partial [Acidobacteria bacterium]|nr:hypothetical protein [Acidobacteriota bacterium]
RGSFNVNHNLGFQRSNSDGAFSIPFSGSPEGEWGPANNDIRHRLNVGINSQALKNLNVFINANMSSASPYTIRTGKDDNGDLVFNDRPAGVGRNTERGARQINGNANASYTISFGKRKVQVPPGIMVMGGPAGVVSVNTVGGGEQPRYRISFNVGVQNIANRVNRTGYNGTMTSPFFRLPTGVGQPRKVEMGIGFSF